MQIAPSTYYQVKSRRPSARARRDEELIPLIGKIYNENYQVYDARKIWEQLHRQGHQVARCTVERLMRRIGIRGVSRGRARRRTTVADRVAAAARPDLLRRDFTAPAPHQRWVADFTYVPISTATVYAAFIVDCFSRFIVGWRLAGHMRTDLPLDALEMALWQRDVRGGQLVHHSDRGCQYLSIRYTERLAEAGASVSVGSKGDSYDNALAETVNGLYKTELVQRHGPWRNLDELELATLEYIDWFNHRRLHSACGYQPPAQYQAIHYDQHNVPVAPAAAQQSEPPRSPGRFSVADRPGLAGQLIVVALDRGLAEPDLLLPLPMQPLGFGQQRQQRLGSIRACPARLSPGRHVLLGRHLPAGLNLGDLQLRPAQVVGHPRTGQPGGSAQPS